jgi:hypothetical protein
MTSSECVDTAVADFLLLREAVHSELTTSDHSFAETRDPIIQTMVLKKEDFGREPDKNEVMPQDQQASVDGYKQRAHGMKVPEFPWNPADPKDQDKIHKYFQEAQETCNEVQYRTCPKCNLKRLRTKVLGYETCPSCPATTNNEKLLTFVMKYKYPENLPKLTQAEAAVLSYYQPAITVTYSQKDGKRYRLQNLILTKQPDKILKAITKELPLKKLDDIINLQTVVRGSERYITVRTDPIKAWATHLIEQNQFYKEKYKTGQLQVDVDWYETTKKDDMNKIPTITVERDNNGEDQTSAGKQATNADDSGDDEGPNEDEENQPNVVHLPQTEMIDDTRPQTYISLNRDHLYQKANRMQKKRNDIIITDETVRVPVKDYLGIDFSAVRPNLYPNGEESPCHVRNPAEIKKALAALLHLNVKKKPEGPDDQYESEDWYPFEEDVIHTALIVAHAQNQEGIKQTKWFITKYPDTTREELNEIIKSMLKGPNSNRKFDTSKVHNFAQHLGNMKQTPQRWLNERKNIETVANDSGEANLFMTLNMNVRFWRDVHNLLHILIHNEPATNDCYTLLKKGHTTHSGKPCFIPDYINNQKTFELLTDRYAGKIEEFLYIKTETFLDTWFHKICGIPTTDRPTKSDVYTTTGGIIWRRVEYTRTRGIQHWHILAKLPGVMHLPSLIRLLNRGRQARVELHKRNIQPQNINDALHHIRLGFLAGRYLSDYADSLVHMDFDDDTPATTSNKKQKNSDQIQNRFRRYNTVVQMARCDEQPLTPDRLPLLKEYAHVPGDIANDRNRMADVAAFTCIHNCIQTACGGNAHGEKCRFGFPRKKMPVTVLGTVCANEDFVETHVYHKRTTTRTSNTNKWALLYWGGNHDFQTIMNFSQINRYATKYVTKQAHSDALTQVLQDILGDEDAYVQMSRDGALIQAFTTANQYRSDMTRHQLYYLALGLPESVSNFTVKPVNIIHKAELKTEINDEGIEVPVDLLEKSLIYAYAERMKRWENNRTNNPPEFPNGLENMSLYDFLRAIKNHAWVDKNGKPAEKGYKNRDPNSGNQWQFTFQDDNTANHVRILNLKETNLARNYSFEENDGVSWDNMSSESKSMLYRAHQELTLFVPWTDSVDKTFLSPQTYEEVNVLTDKDNEIKKKRMEAFMHVYQDLVDRDLVAKHGTPWHRQNQYLYSMWLSKKINKSVRENRAENDGIFSAKFAPGNEDQHLLDESNAAVYEFGDNDAPHYELPEKGIEFELSLHLQNLPPKTPQDLHVVSANAEFWQKQRSWFVQKQENSFLANPSPATITVADLTPQQQFAYTRATRARRGTVLYITGIAGTGKSAVARLIYERVAQSGHICQIAAATAKAAAQFNAPTFHGAFGLSPHSINLDEIITPNTIGKLQLLYKAGITKHECTHFIIDEVNALSADLLAAANTVLQKIFDDPGQQRPWGGRTMIFLGDPLQLPPVKGANLIFTQEEDEEEIPDEEHKRGRGNRVNKTKRERINNNVLTGQTLFKDHLEKNVIVFDTCHRSSGLLPKIMNEVRNGATTVESHRMIMHLPTKFPNAHYDKGVYSDNHSRELMNMVQTVQDAENRNQPVYVSFATYSVKNKTTERFMRGLKPQDFTAPVEDILLLYKGMEVTLVKNINTKAGLTNGTVGTVVDVCYQQKDVKALTEGYHPQPYCIIVDFPDFKGFEDADINDPTTTEKDIDPQDEIAYTKRFKFPVPTWVALFPMDFQLDMSSSKQTRAMFTNTDKKCRTQFPIAPAKNMTAHKSQGQSWPNSIIHIALNLKQMKRPTSKTTTLLYTAGTRSNLLKNCLFEHIPLDTWLNLGKSKAHQALLRYEKLLRINAKLFAQKFKKEHLYDDPEEETPTSLTPTQQAEWAEIQAMTQMPSYNVTLHQPTSLHTCHHITNPTECDGIIAFDLGPKNTGVAVLTKPTEGSPTSQLLELRHVNFDLPTNRPQNWQVALYTPIRNNLQFLAGYFHNSTYNHIHSWSIVIEYFHRYNTYTGSILHTIERVVTELHAGTDKTVTVKACNTQMIHSSKSPIFNLNFTDDELEYLQGQIDFQTLKLLKNTTTTPHQTLLNEEDLREPFESDNDSDVHMDSQLESEDENLDDHDAPQQPAQRQQRKRQPPKTPNPIPPKRARHQATRATKGRYRSQKEHSKRLMSLIADNDIDLGHLSITIPPTVRKYVKDLTTKLDDIGDAFLHACREAYAEPSAYRTFVPGQTLFQTNRCVAVRITVRWCIFIVLFVENKTVRLEHLECHRTGIAQDTHLKSLDPEEFKQALPQSLKDVLLFQHPGSGIHDVDTNQIVLRHTHGSLPHVMLQHLKSFIDDFLQIHPDYTSTTNSLLRPRKVNYNFLDKKLVLVQETSGKHIDALQILPTFLNLGRFLTKNAKNTNNKLSELELDAMYETIVQLLQNLPDDQQHLTLDNLIIPRSLANSFMNLAHIKTNYTHRENRASMWVMDLLLCALNNSVIRPHFKGNRPT